MNQFQTHTNKMSPRSLRPTGRMAGVIKLFSRDERGMSTVEYVILLAVIVIGAVGIWKDIGGKVGKSLSGARDDINKLPEKGAE